MADPVSVVLNIGLQILLRLAIAALTPKQHTEGPRLEDKTLTTSTYGEDIPIGYGTALFTGNVIWGRDITEIATVIEIGKGNPFSLGTNTVYTYFLTFAVGIAERQTERLIRIYADGKLIYKADANGTVLEQMDGLSFRFYKGTETQEPDPIISEDFPDNEVPGYRGMTYIVFDELPLEDFGNRPPQFQFVTTFADEGDTVLSTPLDIPSERLSTNEQVVYDRARDLIYASTLDSSIAILNASTGNLVRIFTFDELDQQISTQQETDRYTTTVNGMDYTVIRRRNQDKINGSSLNFITGGDSPYLVMTFSGGSAPLTVVVEKDTMTVVGTSQDGSPFANAQTLTSAPPVLTDPYIITYGHAWPGRGFAQVVGVTSGFNTHWFYVGGESGLTKTQPIDENGVVAPGSSLANYTDIVIAPLPDFDAYITNGIGGITGDAHDPSTGGPYLGGGTGGDLNMGAIVGGKGDGYTDLYIRSGVATGAAVSLPIKFRIVRVRIFSNGSAVMRILDNDLPDRDAKTFSGNPTTIFGSFGGYDWTAMRAGMMYDPGSDTLVVEGDRVSDGTKFLAGFRANTAGDGDLEMVWSRSNYLIPQEDQTDNSWQSPDGTALVKLSGEANGDANFHILNIETGEIELVDLTQNQWESTDDGSPVGSFGATKFWDGPNNRFLSLFRLQNVSWMQIKPNAVRAGENLKSVVEDICLRSRLTASDIDASALSTKTVRGYPVQQAMTYRKALEPLASVFNFYGIEKDGKIVFDFKDGTTDLVIPEDDLMVAEAGGVVFEEGRTQDEDLPRAIYLEYQSAENDFLDERSVQPARRISAPSNTMQATSEVEVGLALTLTDAEAAEVVQRMLYEAWLAQDRLKFQLPQRYLEILPNDVLQVTAEGRTENVRVDKASIGALLNLEIEARVTEGEVYSLNVQPVSVIGSPNFGSKDTVIHSTKPQAMGFVFDVPHLDGGSTSDTQATYVFAGVLPLGYDDDFVGSALGVSYNNQPHEFRATAQNEAAWGRLLTTMPDIPDGDGWNSVQEETIQVVVFNGASQFTSVTQDNMIQNDANSAILYEPGSGKVEVIGFRDVAVVTTDDVTTYYLTGFMRGKRGTDTLAKNYTGTTYIFILDRDKLEGYLEPSGLVGSDVTYKAVPVGLTADITQQERSLTLNHRSLKPWAPVQAAIRQDEPSTGNWTISWVRRTRYGGNWKDVLPRVPLNEALEQYEIDILSGPGGTVIRTLTTFITQGGAPEAVYTEDMAIADYGSGFPDTLYCVIYQISGTVGRGFGNEFALSLAEDAV